MNSAPLEPRVCESLHGCHSLSLITATLALLLVSVGCYSLSSVRLLVPARRPSDTACAAARCISTVHTVGPPACHLAPGSCPNHATAREPLTHHRLTAIHRRPPGHSPLPPRASRRRLPDDERDTLGEIGGLDRVLPRRPAAIGGGGIPSRCCGGGSRRSRPGEITTADPSTASSEEPPASG